MLSWPATYCNVNGSVYSPASVRKVCRSAWRPAYGWVLRSLVPSMRFITFDDPVRRSRIGALAPDGRIVDLNSACALYLRDVENEGAYHRLAGALLPPNMRKLFAGGDTSLEAARKAFDYVLGSDGLRGPRGEPIFY